MHHEVTAWYGRHARDLPWRQVDRTPWGVLVSEVMLQQTPVARVEPVWFAWMRRWPEPADLADATPADAIREWGRLGYPRRALRLHEAAHAMVEHHDGQVPADYHQLRSLPGVGDYTAAAVAAFAFGRRHAVLDTNVRRVLARAIFGSQHPRASVSAAERSLAESLLPDDGKTAARWSVAMMELGALVCTARTPDCSVCPVRETCAWRLAGAPETDERTRPPQPWHGTDRQVRGRLMAILRNARHAVPTSVLTSAWPDDAQRERALASLIADGLVESTGNHCYRLPE